MATSFFPELLISFPVIFVVVALYIKSSGSRNTSTLLPTNWPIVGVFPSLVSNLHRFHDYFALDILASSQHTFKSCMAGMSFFMTCDPANVQHIFTSNHANYPKGEGFAEMFDVVRGSLFTIDGEPCRRHRATGQSVLSNPGLLASMTKCCRDKVEKGLLPLMAQMARTNTPVDMSDLMVRLVFDLYATTIFGVDPGRLSLDMPPVHVADAMDTVMEVGMVRQMMPAFCWKALRRLRIGPERKLAAAQDVLRSFTTKMVGRRRKTGHPIGLEEEVATSSMDVLSYYVKHPDYNDYLLQVTLISYMIAGRDAISTSLPWVIYNLAKNPQVISRIRDELAPVVSPKATIDSAMVAFEPEEVKPLVYLQAALLESLRLYPPVPMERKSVVASDIMPSGHEVSAGDILLVSIYAMGRMEAIWGPNCREYMPERSLLDKGRQLRHVPSHKFLAFNSGPRMCIGKDIAIMQMKIIIATIVWNFDLDLVDGQSIQPKLSCLLQMKNGLKVKLNERKM